MLTQVQLEAIVLASVDQLRSGGQIEDDRVELKREWPEPTKARQLAGLLNKARGNPVIYIVGLGEDGQVYSTSAVDVSDWWAQTGAGFEGVAPDLVHHINVPVAQGETVAALLFASDRAPYVVKTSGGGSELEVPIRDGTRTRSARRDEMLRMLVPAVTAPPAVLLETSLSADWRGAVRSDPSWPAAGKRAQPQRTSIQGSARIFLEHLGPSGIVLPAHGMWVELSAQDLDMRVNASLWPGGKDAPPPPAFGVQVRHDGVAATGPGSFVARFSWSAEEDMRQHMLAAEEWRVRILFSVVGADRPIDLVTTVWRDSKRAPRLGENFEQLGTWTSRE